MTIMSVVSLFTDVAVAGGVATCGGGAGEEWVELCKWFLANASPPLPTPPHRVEGLRPVHGCSPSTVHRSHAAVGRSVLPTIGVWEPNTVGVLPHWEGVSPVLCCSLNGVKGIMPKCDPLHRVQPHMITFVYNIIFF